jgi:hypothetical protein
MELMLPHQNQNKEVPMDKSLDRIGVLGCKPTFLSTKSFEGPMAREWILNSAVNRFQLNFKRNVGAVSEAIRKCSPKCLSDWEEYYHANVRTREHIQDLGKNSLLRSQRSFPLKSSL